MWFKYGLLKDYLDVSDIKNFAYQAYWENDDILYWCKQLGTSKFRLKIWHIEKIQIMKDNEKDRKNMFTR